MFCSSLKNSGLKIFNHCMENRMGMITYQLLRLFDAYVRTHITLVIVFSILHLFSISFSLEPQRST